MSDKHPNMSDDWYERAVARALAKRLTIMPHPTKRSWCYVTSGSNDDTTYLVSRHECSCEGHKNAGRCYHRAFAIYANDEFNALSVARAGINLRAA